MRVVFHSETKQIITVAEDSDATALPPDLEMIQGGEETIKILGTAIGLDMSQLSISMTPERVRVYKDIVFGKKLIIRFLEENKSVDITTQQNVALLEAFAPLKQLLETGAIETARDLLMISPASNFVLTPPYETVEARKNSYIIQINDYLNEQEQLS